MEKYLKGLMILFWCTYLRSCAETIRRKSKERKVSGKVFKFTANLLNDYLKFPSAKNRLYTSSDINQCLIQLSLSQSYAESGLANLSEKCSTPNKVPTGRTFRGRIERLAEKQIKDALTGANDQVLRILKNHGVFRRKAVAATDYTREPFYGDPNTKNVIGGKQEKGTTWGYSYASIDIVEAGRRLTLYTMTVNQFTEKAQAVEKLISEAKARGVRIGIVLLDRAFFTVDVIRTLKRLGVYFIIPAVKNDKVKEAMLNYCSSQLNASFWAIRGKGSVSTCTFTSGQLSSCPKTGSCVFMTSILVSQRIFPGLQLLCCRRLFLRSTDAGGA